MTPGTGRNDPSSASSQIRAARPSRVPSSCPDATRTPVAMARSWPVPSFGQVRRGEYRAVVMPTVPSDAATCCHRAGPTLSAYAALALGGPPRIT